MAGLPGPRIPFENCPLCGSGDRALLLTADCTRHPLYRPSVPPLMHWLRCGACGHVYTDGYLAPAVLADVFGQTQPAQQPGHAFEQQRVVSARIVERVAAHVRPGRWLDVGFGSGSLLFTAEEWGYLPEGLDLRPASAEALARLGVPARCLDITAVPGEGLYRVISLADVLEHLPFPRPGLAAARRLLEPGGVLFVSMPHYGCAAWRLLDAARANPYWGELEHFHNFSRERLYSLLREEGFDPIHYAISERYRVCMEVIGRRLP